MCFQDPDGACHTTRLSSSPMGWSLIGLDEMARIRAFKANGGSIKGYYRNQRIERKIDI